jgi:hypothetical protein
MFLVLLEPLPCNIQSQMIVTGQTWQETQRLDLYRLLMHRALGQFRLHLPANQITGGARPFVVKGVNASKEWYES